MEGGCSLCHGEKKKLSGGLAGISWVLPPDDRSFAGQNIISDKADFGPSPSPVSVIALSSARGAGPGGGEDRGAGGEGCEAVAPGTSPGTSSIHGWAGNGAGARLQHPGMTTAIPVVFYSLPAGSPALEVLLKGTGTAWSHLLLGLSTQLRSRRPASPPAQPGLGRAALPPRSPPAACPVLFQNPAPRSSRATASLAQGMGAGVKPPRRSRCLQGVRLPALGQQPPSALAVAFPASEPQGRCLPSTTNPAAADRTGSSSSGDAGMKSERPAAIIRSLPASRRILHRPGTDGSRPKPGAPRTNWGQAGAPGCSQGAGGTKPGGLARPEQRAAGWPRPRMPPTLAARLESVY